MDPFDLIRWILAALVGLFCAMSLACNIGATSCWYFDRKTGSGVPLFGSFAGALAIVLAPVDDISTRWKWCLLPFAAECAVWWVFWIAEWIRRAKSPSQQPADSAH